ncbi:hypothetical protein Neosp_015091 [[Neocosmospora] mangrovei]
MTDAPTPIIDSPEGIIKVFDDLDHWVKGLQDCRGVGEKTAKYQLFFQDFDVSVNTIGGMRDGWAIVMEYILSLEKNLRNAFGPLDRDVTKLGQDLGANPAAKRWIQEAKASTWNKFLDSMPCRVAWKLAMRFVASGRSRVRRLEHLLDEATDDKQTAYDLGQTMFNLTKLETMSLADIKMMELELQQWVGKMTGPVKKLHFVDLDK